ncbi:MAG: polysaccharide deacetylase family protein [Burkholderiales bacterium]
MDAKFTVRRASLRAVHPLKTHGRYAYSAITRRRDYSWPRSRRLAVYVGFHLEQFEFDAGDVLGYATRDYGNRVGVWRCLDLFDELSLRVGTLVNTACYDHCPEVVDAFVKRGDELIGYGHSSSLRQGELREADEKWLLQYCRARIGKESGADATGWLSPGVSESVRTPDLLVEAGYRYTLNWCHDDQPIEMHTRAGQLWSIPYPQDLNDLPMIVARQMDARDFADMLVDNFDQMLEQSHAQPLVMGIALRPYIVGQPYRLRHVRRALEHMHREKRVWWTTPGAICDWLSQK